MIAVAQHRLFERGQHLAKDETRFARAVHGPDESLLVQVAGQLHERRRGLGRVAVRFDFGHLDQRGNHHVNAAHQDHVARAVAQPLVVGEHDVAEGGLHPMGRADHGIRQLGQLLVVERGEASEDLSVALGIAADHESMDRAEADFEPGRGECRRQHRHGRLVAGVGQVVHRFAKRVGQVGLLPRQGLEQGVCAVRPLRAKSRLDCLIDTLAEAWTGEAAHTAASASLVDDWSSGDRQFALQSDPVLGKWELSAQTSQPETPNRPEQAVPDDRNYERAAPCNRFP